MQHDFIFKKNIEKKNITFFPHVAARHSHILSNGFNGHNWSHFYL